MPYSSHVSKGILLRATKWSTFATFAQIVRFSRADDNEPLSVKTSLPPLQIQAFYPRILSNEIKFWLKVPRRDKIRRNFTSMVTQIRTNCSSIEVKFRLTLTLPEGLLWKIIWLGSVFMFISWIWRGGIQVLRETGSLSSALLLSMFCLTANISEIMVKLLMVYFI